MIPIAFFFVGLLSAASGFASPPVALATGLVFGLVFRHPYPRESARFSKILLQASVVGLGFGMNLQAILRAGRSGFVYTLLSIAVAMLVGMLLGRFLEVERISAYLISIGTAICGGFATLTRSTLLLAGSTIFSASAVPFASITL